jgi:hypothetical protein
MAAFLLVVHSSVPTGAATSTAPVGNVSPNFQPLPGRVAAVATSAPVDGQVAVLVQNGTGNAARVHLIVVTTTRPDGGFTTRARTSTVYPQVLAPGELALAAVRFRTRDVPPGATFAVKVRSTRAPDAQLDRGLAASEIVLSAPQSGPVAQTLTATLTNISGSRAAAHPGAAVMCFGEAGTPTSFAHARPSDRRVAPAKTASVSVPLTSLCPSYLVAARAA